MDNDPKMDFLNDLALVGDPIGVEGEGKEAQYIIQGTNPLMPNEQVDLSMAWSDFKHDIAILKEAGVSLVYGASTSPQAGEEHWVMKVWGSTIKV